MGRNSIRRNSRHWVSSFGCVLFGTLPRQSPFPLGMAVLLSWSLSRLLRFSRSQPQRSLGLRCTEPGRRVRSHEVCSETTQIHRLWNGTCQGQLPPLARSFPLNPRWVRLEGTIKWTLQQLRQLRTRMLHLDSWRHRWWRQLDGRRVPLRFCVCLLPLLFLPLRVARVLPERGRRPWPL